VRVHGMLRECESRAQVRLDLRGARAGDEMRETMSSRIVKVFHPAHAIKVVLSRSRVFEADILVDQCFAADGAEIEGDEATAMPVQEHAAVDLRILQHCIEERARQEIEL